MNTILQAIAKTEAELALLTKYQNEHTPGYCIASDDLMYSVTRDNDTKKALVSFSHKPYVFEFKSAADRVASTFLARNGRGEIKWMVMDLERYADLVIPELLESLQILKEHPDAQINPELT
jgi:hypothetical protein